MKTHILHNFMIFMLANIAFTDLYLTLHRQVLQTLLLQILILPCADRYYRHCFYRFWSYLVQTGITDIAFTDFDLTSRRQVLQTFLLQILHLFPHWPNMENFISLHVKHTYNKSLYSLQYVYILKFCFLWVVSAL